MRVTPVGGGCISEAGRVELAGGGTVFAKCGAGLPEGLLEVEADGLGWLGEAAGVRVPGVVARTADVLVIDWVEPGHPRPPPAGTSGAGWPRCTRRARPASAGTATASSAR